MLTAEVIAVKDPDGGNTQDMGDLEKPAKPADTPSNKKKSMETGGLGKDKTIIQLKRTLNGTEYQITSSR